MGAKTVLVNGCQNGRVAIIKVEKKIRVANLRVTKLLQPSCIHCYLKCALALTHFLDHSLDNLCILYFIFCVMKDNIFFLLDWDSSVKEIDFPFLHYSAWAGWLEFKKVHDKRRDHMEMENPLQLKHIGKFVTFQSKINFHGFFPNKLLIKFRKIQNYA